MKDTYIIDWKNGVFSVETEPPGEGAIATAEGLLSLTKHSV